HEAPQQVASAASPAPQPNVRQPEPVATSSQSGKQATRALRDIAAVSTRPDQVKATTRPTTQPIVASVKAPSSSDAPGEAGSGKTPPNPSLSASMRRAPPRDAPGRSANHRDAVDDNQPCENGQE